MGMITTIDKFSDPLLSTTKQLQLIVGSFVGLSFAQCHLSEKKNTILPSGPQPASQSRVGKSLTFLLKSRSIFLIFPQTLLIFFLILARYCLPWCRGRVGCQSQQDYCQNPKIIIISDMRTKLAVFVIIICFFVISKEPIKIAYSWDFYKNLKNQPFLKENPL